MNAYGKQWFLRTYGHRIEKLTDYRSVDGWFELYDSEGTRVFLEYLEDEEDFSDFCGKYYAILREAFNIRKDDMNDYYRSYKGNFNGDDAKFQADLRRNPRIAECMDKLGKNPV
jgi:hypothetical protein